MDVLRAASHGDWTQLRTLLSEPRAALSEQQQQWPASKNTVQWRGEEWEPLLPEALNALCPAPLHSLHARTPLWTDTMESVLMEGGDPHCPSSRLPDTTIAATLLLLYTQTLSVPEEDGEPGQAYDEACKSLCRVAEHSNLTLSSFNYHVDGHPTSHTRVAQLAYTLQRHRVRLVPTSSITAAWNLVTEDARLSNLDNSEQRQELFSQLATSLSDVDELHATHPHMALVHCKLLRRHLAVIPCAALHKRSVALVSLLGDVVRKDFPADRGAVRDLLSVLLEWLRGVVREEKGDVHSHTVLQLVGHVFAVCERSAYESDTDALCLALLCLYQVLCVPHGVYLPDDQPQRLIRLFRRLLFRAPPLPPLRFSEHFVKLLTKVPFLFRVGVLELRSLDEYLSDMLRLWEPWVANHAPRPLHVYLERHWLPLVWSLSSVVGLLRENEIPNKDALLSACADVLQRSSSQAVMACTTGFCHALKEEDELFTPLLRRMVQEALEDPTQHEFVCVALAHCPWGVPPAQEAVERSADLLLQEICTAVDFRVCLRGSNMDECTAWLQQRMSRPCFRVLPLMAESLSSLVLQSASPATLHSVVEQVYQQAVALHGAWRRARRKFAKIAKKGFVEMHNTLFQCTVALLWGVASRLNQPDDVHLVPVALELLSLVEFSHVKSKRHTVLMEQFVRAGYDDPGMVQQYVDGLTLDHADTLLEEDQDADAGADTTDTERDLLPLSRDFLRMVVLQNWASLVSPAEVEDVVLVLVLRYANSPYKALNQRAHLLFQAAFNHHAATLSASHALRACVPSYCRAMLEHFPQRVTFSSLATSVLSVVQCPHTRDIDHAHDVRLFCIRMLADRVKELVQVSTHGLLVGTQQHPVQPPKFPMKLASLLFSTLQWVRLPHVPLVLAMLEEVVDVCPVPGRVWCFAAFHTVLMKQFELTRKDHCVAWYIDMYHRYRSDMMPSLGLSKL